MSLIAPILQAFLTDHLIAGRRASHHTVAAYRDTFVLLVGFAYRQRGIAPARLDFNDLDAPLVSAFLQHLRSERGNTVTTRNARLAAIHSLFRYAALRAPEHAATIQRVLAIPTQRSDRAIISYLTREETEALLGACDQNTWLGCRDHALLMLTAQTGLRVSELISLTRSDVHLDTGAHVRCVGKGRKQRCTPLTTQTVRALRLWLRHHQGCDDDPMFYTRRGGALSRDAVERLITKYATAATRTCPTLQTKTVSPHVLRHTAAMALLHAGVDTSVIALWLGHESTTTTQIYLHADMSIKERALARTTPPDSTSGRYQAPDSLLAFLDSL